MAEGNDFSVFQEDGREEFQCNFCDYKSNTQKGVRTHLTVKHKTEKASKKPSQEAVPISADGFNFDSVPKSTQNPSNEPPSIQITTDQILAMYKPEKTEEPLDSSELARFIPDDTIDKVIAELSEPTTEEINGMDESETAPAEVDPTRRMEMENENLKKSIESYKTKVDELEINVLNSQIEVSALTEEVQQLKDEDRLKDQQNAILLGEKNSLDVKICELDNRVSKINGAIHRIFNEKESMKQIIEKQKTTIDFLQNKSPGSNTPPTNGNAAETIKKLNDNLKVKTKDLVDERKKNKELVEELSELQNKLNGKDDNSTDTEKCVKLTKVVSNKSKEIVELNSRGGSQKT